MKRLVKLDINVLDKYIYKHKDSKRIYKELKANFKRNAIQRKARKLHPYLSTIEPSINCEEVKNENLNKGVVNDMHGDELGNKHQLNEEEYEINKILDKESMVELTKKLNKIQKANREDIRPFAESLILLFLRNVPKADKDKWKLINGMVEKCIPSKYREDYKIAINQIIDYKQLPLT